MAKKLYEESEIADIAVAIREQGGTGKYKTRQMGDAIRAISGAEPLVEYDQQNPLLTQYLAESAGYSPDDYTTSVALSYAYKKPAFVKCHPTGYTVTIKQGGELHLTDGGEVLTKTVEAGDHLLINTTPDEVAHWWLTVGGSVKQCGTIKPTGAIRMIATPAINVRDLGGWACDGGTVKYGKLFRGGLLTEPDRYRLVDQLSIRYDLDLRSKGDNGGIAESPLGSEVYYKPAPAQVYYTLSNSEYWQYVLRTIFNAVAHNEPLIFHCAAGSDRTGTVACIVEALLGMDQSDIDRDFEISTFGISLGANENNARRRTDRHTDENPEPKWRDLIEEITAKDGDTFTQKVVNWCGNTLGFTADEINAFRRAMIDGNPADVVVESIVESEYQRVEWVRIVEAEASKTASHVRTKLAWADVNKIVCKFACAHTATTKDMLFAAYDGASVGSAPFAATQSGYILTNSSGLTNYAVSPNNIPTNDREPHEYTLTFSCSNANPIKFGGWGDDAYSHPHDWYFVQFYKDDALLAEFIPHYRKDDPTAGGFLETVSREFYLDAGRGNVGFAIMGDPI